VDIITGQSLIIEQLTLGWGKLMSTDIVSMFIMVLQCRATTYLDSTWRPSGVSVGCIGTPYSPACRLFHKPLGLFLWERWHPIPVRRTISPAT